MRSRLLPLALLLSVSPAAAADYINDPLTSASFDGRGSQGGSFEAEGWKTTGTTDAIWYEIGDALVEGKIGFSVRGMAHSGGPLSGADHDIFAMYQAPTGQGEPVQYSPYFRNNDFKAFLRVFGDQEPGRAGAMKLEFVHCPRGEPWHHDDPCPAECDHSGLAYANGADKDIGWDAAAWYRIELSWGNGSISFSRDGQQLASIQYPGTYAPKPLRVRIGSPRHGVSEVAVMPLGLTFKDVTVSGTPGAMTEICVPPETGGAGGEAGSSPAGGEGGAPPAGAGGEAGQQAAGAPPAGTGGAPPAGAGGAPPAGAGGAPTAGGAGASAGGAGNACIPGQQLPCACPGTSTKGVQICNADGKGLGACVGCPNTSGGKGGAGGAAGKGGSAGKGGQAQVTGEETSDDGGCGCRAAPVGAAGGWLAVGAALLTRLRRSARRR